MIPTPNLVRIKPRLPWDDAAVRDHILEKTKMACSSGVMQNEEVVDIFCTAPHVRMCSWGASWLRRCLLKLERNSEINV